MHRKSSCYLRVTNRLDTVAPILLCVYNRPELVEQQLRILRSVDLSSLYVFSDGPKNDSESDTKKVTAVRELLREQASNLPIILEAKESNHGLGLGMRSAIRWFFSHEAEGIILEDDCLADRTFFYFATRMLNFYRFDSRISQICGNTLYPHSEGWPYDHWFSRVPHIWGWATWRRAWESFEILSDLGSRELENSIRLIAGQTRSNERRLQTRVAKMISGEVDNWDGVWFAATVASSGLTVFPRQNLVGNVGFGREATNTRNTWSLISGALPPVEPHVSGLPYPPLPTPWMEADRFTMTVFHAGNGQLVRSIHRIFFRLKRFLSMKPRPLNRLSLTAAASRRN